MQLRTLVLSMSLLLSIGMLNAQAIPTADRAGRIQIGVGLTAARPDYNSGTNKGWSAYGDLDFSRHIGLEADAHVANVITPGDIGENSFLVGPRFVLEHGPLYPYVKLLGGVGIFIFEPVYVNSVSASSRYGVYAVGGGLDIHIARKVNIRAFDLEFQSWPSFSTSGLTPIVGTVGVAFNF